MDNIADIDQELDILENILGYEIKLIDSATKFWMIRTKKGYFYTEFISNGFVALAWNIISSTTSFADSLLDTLKDQILINYSEIKRPSTVINKCKSFIHDVKPGDYIIIPNAGSELITIALAGEYYEEESKTYEIEREVISRIENRDVLINDVTCPYKKRRRITHLTTLKSSEIDGRLLKAISNYHGISNFNDYWRSILALLYDAYSYKNSLNIVYHVRRSTPIGPRMLSQLLWAATDCWCFLVDENTISTQINVSSPGPVDFSIVNNIPAILDAAKILAGITVGTLAFVKPEAIPTLLKNLFSLPAEINREYITTKREAFQNEKDKEMFPLEFKQKQLEILEKKLSILENLKSFGIEPQKLAESAIALADTFSYLEIENVAKNKESVLVQETYENDELLEEEVAEEEQ